MIFNNGILYKALSLLQHLPKEMEHIPRSFMKGPSTQTLSTQTPPPLFQMPLQIVVLKSWISV
jgi:hypothetical protein